MFTVTFVVVATLIFAFHVYAIILVMHHHNGLLIFFYTCRRDIELQDTHASSPSQILTYEVVDTPGPVEYEEIDKFQETRRNPVKIEHPHPPKGEYEYSQCPAYAQSQVPLPPQH